MESMIVVRQLFFKYTRPICLVLGIVLATAVSSAAQEPEGHTALPTPQGVFTHEIHAVYLIGGQITGSYDERSDTTATGETRTVINSDLIFNRMGSKLEMKSSSRYDETREAQLSSAAGDVSSSEQITHIEASAISSSLQIKTTTGGKSYERTVALSGVLLGPEGARRLVLSRCHAPGDTITYNAFFPELGSLVTITDVVIGMEDVSTDQGKIPGLKIEQTISAMPGKITLWLDRDGWLLRQIMPSPLGDIEAIRGNAPRSNSQVQGAALPEETFTQSIVKANVRLPEERFVDSIRLKIIHEQPELGWPNLETDNQHVIERTANYVVLEVNRPQPKGRQTLPVATDAALAPYLSPNALLQSDDPSILAIARNVVGGERDAWKAARALQLWTNEHMQFDLGIALAPASEVARNRRGTCFGYAMLLGALTRAAGIPSRLRMGYVYAGGIWGGHAWIDVRIGNDWIPLDSALYTPGPADAARFSFFTSALEEGTLAGIGSLGQLFSHADIKVLQYTVAGRSTDVPERAAPFVIDKDTYRNPWLGLSIMKPSSFQFTESDMAWPQTTVIAMQGPQSQKVEVANPSASVTTPEFDAEQRLRSAGITGRHFTMLIAGKTAVAVSSAQKAGAVLIDYGNVWMISATGPDAKRLLKLVSSTVTLAR
jgi:hypothetical protein